MKPKVVPGKSSIASSNSSEDEDRIPVVPQIRASRREEGNLNPTSRRGSALEDVDRQQDAGGALTPVLPAPSGKRNSCELLGVHLAGSDDAELRFGAGTNIQKKTAKENVLVVRGPDWRYGDEDGGSGRPGTITEVNEKASTATVTWHQTGITHSHYRIRKRFDLSEAIQQQQMGPPQPSRSSATKLITGAMQHMNLLPVPQAPARVRDSQQAFADKEQTIIIFDWDDTLFPSTYVRHDLHLSLRKHLKDQAIPRDLKQEVAHYLSKCAASVEQLVRLAEMCGKVVLVTLAREPWVTDSCRYFYPRIGQLLDQMKLKIVYAQEGEQVDYNKLKMAADEEVEKFWSAMKGRAISREVADFYSQYDGQSWKNIISIGDSDFERLGTMKACEEYMTQQGLVEGTKTPGCAVVDNHRYKVRTKTFKMVDQPTIEELTVQINMVRQWLPLMVALDDAFDVDISSLDDMEEIKAIQAILSGKQPPPSSQPSQNQSPMESPRSGNTAK